MSSGPIQLGVVARIGLLLAAGASVVGCASVPREAGFGDVGRAVAERTGGKQVHWNQGTAADAAVAARVESMLRDELGPDEAIQIALLNNRDVQAVYEELMVAQADLVAAGLLPNPLLNVEGIRFFDPGPSVELGVAMNFLELLYIPLRRRVAGAQFEATKARVAGAVLDLAADVRAAYYELQGSQQMLEMRQQVAVATEASYDIARRMREAGNIPELDMLNQRSLYEQSKINLAAAEARVIQDREALNELMGLWGGQARWTIAARLPDPSADPVMGEGLERVALERSLDLQAARRNIEAAAARLGIARPFGLFPTADIGFSAEREPAGDWGFGPEFAFPLPLFNQGQPLVATAMAEYRQAQQRFAALAVSIRSRVRAAQVGAIEARDRANYYRRVVLPLRQRIVEQTQRQYNAMQIGPVELLLAKQQQIDVAAEYIAALEDYWISKARLDQILAGRLTRAEQRGTRSMTGVTGITSVGGGSGGSGGGGMGN